MLIYTPYDKFAPAIRDVTNHPCPVSTLPTELLQEIFAFSMTKKPRPRIVAGIPDEELKPTGFQNTALFLTWVCSQWRLITLSMPELWATMMIYKPKKYTIELVKVYLSQSGDSTPLDLTLSQGHVADHLDYHFLERFPEHGVTVEILKLWVPQAHRWRTIDLNMKGTTPLHELPNIRLNALSSVQEAHLSFLNTPRHSKDVIEWLWGQIFRSPALRVAYWHDLHLGDSLPPAPFSHLVEFKVFLSTLDELVSILPSCECLKRLHIHSFASGRSKPSIPSSQPAIVLPRLEYLKLDLGKELSNLLNYITAPALQELCISDSSQSPFADVHSLEQVLQRSSCTLRALSLHQGADRNETPAIEYLCHAAKHMTSLESLSLSWNKLSEKTIALFNPKIMGDDAPFSSLRDLELRGVDTMDGIISSMVESRCAAGVSLRRFTCSIAYVPQVNTSGYPRDEAFFEKLRHSGLQLYWFFWDNDE